MRVPISYGLSYPQRIASGASRLDFESLAGLSFEVADAQRFPGLHLAWQVLRAAHGSSAVLNAANEVAVAAFLQGKIGFDAIHALNLHTLDKLPPMLNDDATLDDLLALDERARAVALGWVKEHARC
jgi:1-deoxy-D-xylulose-5-phosphate reductoisomerase